MKTITLAIVLACALAAAAQTQPAPAGGTQQGNAPEIKDPAEYNAYVSAIQQQDPNAKISALEAFLTQYPNSVMKMTGLELLMNTYLQAGNQPKVVDAAKRVLAADSCNLRALALLTYLARQGVASGQGQGLPDLQQYSSKGLECSSTAPKPAGLKDDEWEKLKKQTAIIFNGGAGFAALQSKDYPTAQKDLRAAVEAEPNDLQNVYPLAMSYLTATPQDFQNGIFFIARAANLAQGAASDQIKGYAQKVYKNYHGSVDDKWNATLFCTKTATAPATGCPPDISKYEPPTPAQQAHELVNGKSPNEIKQLSFGEWELVLSAGSPEDQDKVWSVIKGVPLQMEGTVISAQDVGDGPSKMTQVQVAASEDDIEKKQADITLTMTGVIPPRTYPKAGDTLDFEGTPVDYTSAVHNPTGAPGAAAATGATPGAPGPDASQAAGPASTATQTPGATPSGTAQGTASTPAAGAPGNAPAAGAPNIPFMMTMEKGALLKKAGATPARKPTPTRRRTTTRKPQ